MKVREGLAALPAPPALLMGTNPTGTNEGAGRRASARRFAFDAGTALIAAERRTGPPELDDPERPGVGQESIDA